MSINYGNKGFALGPSNISQINLTSCTYDSTFLDGNFYGWSFTMGNVSCGATGFNLIINDATIPFQWTKISWKTYIGFTSSCWSFATGNTSYGTGSHNILGWDPALGDSISRPVNSFELPQYTLKMSACDNASDNFVHQTYATGSFRQWNMIRRRDGTNTAGPAAGFACTAGGVCKISQIMVYR